MTVMIHITGTTDCITKIVSGGITLEGKEYAAIRPAPHGRIA